VSSSGFFPVVCRWWGDLADELEAQGDPWPEAAAKIDLRWWADYARSGAVEFPGRRRLARRWSWKENDVRKLLADPEAWEDPRHSGERPAHSPATHPEVTRPSPAPARSKAEKRPKPTRSAPASHPDVTRTSTTQTHTPTGSEYARGKDPGAEAVPKWVRAWLKADGRRLKADGVRALEVLGGLGQALEAIRGTSKVPSESASRPVLRLWREALEVGAAATLPELVALVELLAAACQEAPDHVFRNDVRGIRQDGSSWKADTSREPGAVCRLAPKPGSEGATWERRLELARKWDAAGRPKEGQLLGGNRPRSTGGGSRYARRLARRVRDNDDEEDP